MPAHDKGAKPKRYTSDNNNHLSLLCHCRSRTTRKGRVYENATKCTRMSCKALSSNACCRSLKVRSPTYLTEAWIQAFEKRLLADQRLSNLVVVEREGILPLYKGKPLEEPRVKWWERRLARRGQAWLLGRQHQLLPGPPGGRVTSQQMSCGNNARVEGLDVTLDDPAGLRGRVLMNGWMWVRDSSEGELRLGPLAVLRKLNHKWFEGWSDTHGP